MHEDHNRRALPAAGEPEVPEPFHKEASTFGWPDLYTVDQLRTYGASCAEHARRVAMEDGPLVEIGENGEGVKKMAPMRRALELAQMAAEVEAREADRLRAELQAIRAAQQGETR